MTEVDIDLEMSLATNMFGSIKSDIRDRLQAVVENPTQETWDNAYTIILSNSGMMTLWQAVLEVDKTFTRFGPSTYKVGRRWVTEPWAKIPDQATLIRALRFATH